MDKEVSAILIKHGIPQSSISDLESSLMQARCVIYKSELPPINGETILHINGTPDKDYPLRILQAYRQNCDCKWADNTGKNEPTNSLFKMMNEQNDKRAMLLDKAITKLLAG